MAKLWQRIREAWYGALPILLLVGIPTVIGIVIGVISIWDDMPKIVRFITNIGDGYLVVGIMLLVLGFIGLIIAFTAFMMWLKAFLNWLDKHATNRFEFYFPIFVVTFALYAFFVIIKKLP